MNLHDYDDNQQAAPAEDTRLDEIIKTVPGASRYWKRGSAEGTETL
jgi:hypothetical protein